MLNGGTACRIERSTIFFKVKLFLRLAYVSDSMKNFLLLPGTLIHSNNTSAGKNKDSNLLLKREDVLPLFNTLLFVSSPNKFFVVQLLFPIVQF